MINVKNPHLSKKEKRALDWICKNAAFVPAMEYPATDKILKDINSTRQFLLSSYCPENFDYILEELNTEELRLTNYNDYNSDPYQILSVLIPFKECDVDAMLEEDFNQK